MPRGQRRELARIVRENPLFSLTSPWAHFDPAKRIEDLREFVEAGKGPAIFDAWTLVIEHEVGLTELVAARDPILYRGNIEVHRR
jgi:ABC-type lipopolysaccharide export system ATPase subunit